MAQGKRCNACGAEIKFVRTRAGSYMPCNAKTVNYRTKPGGPQKVVTPAGDVISCEIVISPSEATGWGYEPHWATCSAPNWFRH